MENKRTKRGSIKYVILLLAVLACIPVGRLIARAALENENNTEVLSVQVKDADIEVSTLVVGSHLIHIQGLTETLYGMALESANEFNQGSLYYKSELADGQWYEITDASSIADITTDGKLINKSVIEALGFTHKTDAKGVTTDLRNGQTVCIFDINSPYDLETMQELEPLRLQYDVLLEKPEDNRTESDNKYIDMIRELFEEDLRTEDCINCDTYVEALERYKEDLAGRDASAAWTQTLDGVMETVDATRRVMVFYQLDPLLNALLYRAQGLQEPYPSDEPERLPIPWNNGTDDEQTDGGQTEEDEEETEADEGETEADSSLVVNSEIVAAIGESINQVASSQSSYEAKLLAEGMTVISKHRYDWTNDLILYADADDYSNCDTVVAQLCALTDIMEDKVVDVATELSLLDGELVPKTKDNYESALKAGVSGDYVRAVADGVSAAVSVQYLKEQQSAADMLRLDYQTMLDAKWKRMKNADAQQDVLSRLDGIAALAELVQPDDAYTYLQESISVHKSWLMESYGELVAQGSGSSEMDELTEEKEQLKRRYQDALDKNDLSAAALLEAKLAALQADIDALEKDYLAILNSKNSSESDKAKAAAGLGDGSGATAINKLGDDFVNALQGAQGTSEDELQRLLAELQNLLAALRQLAQMNPDAAAGALDKMNDALSDGTASAEGDASAGSFPLSGADLAAIQNAVTDLQTEVGQASDNDHGATMSADAAKQLLDAALKELFGSDYAGASDVVKAQALLATEWFGEQTGNQNIASLAANMASEQAEAGSRYLYEKYTAETGDYVSLHAAGGILDYRTIFDNVHMVETLNNGTSYYTFTNGKKVYEMTGETSKLMNRAAGLQNKQLYLASSDAKKIFSVEAESIDLASHAVAYTGQMRSDAEKILEKMKEGGS